ncbi:hypothetical protein LguiA_029511 [Lonicera macranthoides]
MSFPPVQLSRKLLSANRLIGRRQGRTREFELGMGLGEEGGEWLTKFLHVGLPRSPRPSVDPPMDRRVFDKFSDFFISRLHCESSKQFPFNVVHLICYCWPLYSI